MQETNDVWTRQAAQWQRVGPPLRPSHEDLAAYAGAVQAATRRGRPLRALLLGVTPELATLPWPPGTDLVAVDRNAGMIASVWPAAAAPGPGALQADWRSLPMPDASRDLILGDGSLNVVPFPRDTRLVLASVARVLAPAGLAVLRLFARPATPETVEAVFEDAMEGRTGSFHALKLRLLMACQWLERTTVCLHDVWSVWNSAGPDPDLLHARTGWPREQIATIEAYRDQETIYSFPTLDELRALAADCGLEEKDCSTGGYELGARCPRLVFGLSSGPGSKR